MKGKWFQFVRQSPSPRARLFCFPFAGGGAAAFRAWREILPEEIDLFPVQYPGRGSRVAEAPLAGMDEMVERIREAIRPYLDVPYAFFGHSMGATVCFETARALRRSGDPLPERAFVSARPAPHEPSDRPDRHTMPDAEFLDVLRELEGTPKEFFDHPELIEFMLPVLRADFQLLETYAFREEQPFSFPITALSGVDDPDTPPEKMSSWGRHTTGPFKEISYSGGHFYLEQRARELGREIVANLLRPSLANSR